LPDDPSEAGVGALLEAEDAGRRAATAYRREPSRLPDSPLGAFSAAISFRGIVLRRALLGLDVPPRALSWLRPLLGSRRREHTDAFLRDYAYWRGVRHGLDQTDYYRRISRGPVILMYHAVGREPPSRYVVPQARFGRQMAWLKWRGYQVMSLRDLLAHRRENRLPPPRSVILTFDDGYADNWELASPTLQRYGFAATVFLVSGALGGVPTWTSEPALKDRPLLTISQIRDLMAAGIEIGAHTRTHPSLTAVADPMTRESEVRGSREDLERCVGGPVRSFAYPFGDYDTELLALVERAGYEGACCSRSGINDPGAPAYELCRVEVRGTDSLLTFARMVWRGHRP
jgi:peptidoglycan/xylan/chitin deacetylase (PgdA/CDA1 family)